MERLTLQCEILACKWCQKFNRWSDCDARDDAI